MMIHTVLSYKAKVLKKVWIFLICSNFYAMQIVCSLTSLKSGLPQAIAVTKMC